MILFKSRAYWFNEGLSSGVSLGASGMYSEVVHIIKSHYCPINGEDDLLTKIENKYKEINNIEKYEKIL